MAIIFIFSTSNQFFHDNFLVFWKFIVQKKRGKKISQLLENPTPTPVAFFPHKKGGNSCDIGTIGIISLNTRFTALDGTGNIVDFQLTAVPPLVLSRFWIFKWLVSQLKRPTNLKKKPRSLPVYIGNTVACFHSKKENKIYVLFRSFDNKDLSEILKESKPLNFLMWFDDR